MEAATQAENDATLAEHDDKAGPSKVSRNLFQEEKPGEQNVLPDNAIYDSDEDNFCILTTNHNISVNTTEGNEHVVETETENVDDDDNPHSVTDDVQVGNVNDDELIERNVAEILQKNRN